MAACGVYGCGLWKLVLANRVGAGWRVLGDVPEGSENVSKPRRYDKAALASNG